MMGNSGSCKICAVIHFPHTKNMSAAEVHHELCVVYVQNVMSEETVRKLCTILKHGQTNVHEEEQSGRPPVVSE
jgi:hypothetical protein